MNEFSGETSLQWYARHLNSSPEYLHRWTLPIKTSEAMNAIRNPGRTVWAMGDRIYALCYATKYIDEEVMEFRLLEIREVWALKTSRPPRMLFLDEMHEFVVKNLDTDNSSVHSSATRFPPPPQGDL